MTSRDAGKGATARVSCGPWRRRVRAAVVWSASLVVSALPLAAQPSTIDFSVSGTSTVRSWTCTAKGVIAVTPSTGGAPPLPGFPSGVQAATLTVPLETFACPNDEMTQHLNEAMKAEQFPEIVYRLERYEVAAGRAQVTGTMTITGVSKPVSVPVTFKESAGGLYVEGNTRLEFATFDLEPPTVMLGLMKVGPQIRIAFKGVVAP
ncbi:MAG: YceI family protein [Acidobacteriota bacterium]